MCRSLRVFKEVINHNGGGGRPGAISEEQSHVINHNGGGGRPGAISEEQSHVIEGLPARYAVFFALGHEINIM